MFILNNLSLINHYIMSKINKIQLSGTVYDIQDLDITKKADTSAVTQALSSKTDTSVFNTYSAATDARMLEDEQVTAAALNVLNDTKQDTLVAGSGITISGNVISADGGEGGKAVSGGTNISITTGETADTINCTLNLNNGSGNYSIQGKRGSALGQDSFSFGNNTYARKERTFAFGATVDVKEINSFGFGFNNIVNAPYSFGFGQQIRTNGWYNFAFGEYITTNNKYEIGYGSYNNSVTASTTFGNSGNTLFSVGNGYNNSNRHNAFEIRQNGDIYIADTNDTSTSNYYAKPMVKLQDALGGGSITVDSALSSTSENPVQNKVIYQAIGDIETLLAAI